MYGRESERHADDDDRIDSQLEQEEEAELAKKDAAKQQSKEAKK